MTTSDEQREVEAERLLRDAEDRAVSDGAATGLLAELRQELLAELRERRAAAEAVRLMRHERLLLARTVVERLTPPWAAVAYAVAALVLALSHSGFALRYSNGDLWIGVEVPRPRMLAGSNVDADTADRPTSPAGGGIAPEPEL